MKRVSMVCLLALVLVQPVNAHPVPFSFLDFKLTSAGIEASLILHDFDLAHDLGITSVERLHDPAFLSERQSSIRALLSERFGIEHSTLQVEERPGGPLEIEPLPERA